MRQPARTGQRGAPKTKSVSLPAPIGGLNARDSVANMRSTDAIILDNYFPTTTTVDARRGYTQHATFTGSCETVLVYAGVSATKVFVAVNTTNDLIMEATSGGAISSAVVGGSGPTVQAITNSRFDYANFGTSGGQFLVAVNGADTPLQYDGSSWTASTMTGGTPADFFTVAVYAERLWFGVKNSLRVRYLPVNSVTGLTVDLNLSSLFELGGYLNSIVTVTDASNALADYIAFVSSEGEIVAFSGTDPADPAAWQRVAQFRVGRPVIKGNRCWTKWGADALLICSDGILPLRRAISTNNRDATTTVSDKIRNIINSDVRINGARYGWSLNLHPSGFKLILNVITSELSTARQYVMNVQTGAWCRFTGWNAFCFDVAQDQLYFGGAGFLAKADQTSALDDAGSAILTDAKQAYNYLAGRGRTAQVTLMRPIIALDGSASVAVGVDTDYVDRPPTAYKTVGGSTGDPWGGIWDAAWGGATQVVKDWRSVNGFGSAIAPRMRAQINDINFSWSVTDFIFEPGAAVG